MPGSLGRRKALNGLKRIRKTGASRVIGEMGGWLSPAGRPEARTWGERPSGRCLKGLCVVGRGALVP